MIRGIFCLIEYTAAVSDMPHFFKRNPYLWLFSFSLFPRNPDFWGVFSIISMVCSLSSIMVTASFYNDEKWDGGRSASKFTLNFGVRWGFPSQCYEYCISHWIFYQTNIRVRTKVIIIPLRFPRLSQNNFPISLHSTTNSRMAQQKDTIFLVCQFKISSLGQNFEYLFVISYPH